MTHGILLSSYNARSGRRAMLEDDRDMALLFLSAPGSEFPQRDILVYLHDSGLRPDPARSPQAFPRYSRFSDNRQDFSFLWSDDGEAVALLHRNIPQAFLHADLSQGCTLAIDRSSPLGTPWDAKLFEWLFLSPPQPSRFNPLGLLLGPDRTGSRPGRYPLEA